MACFRGLGKLALILAAANSCVASSNFLVPLKMTFASADPVAAQEFAIRYLGGIAKQQPYAGGNGQCAMIKWVQFPNTNPAPYVPYQLHFVKAYNYPNGSMTLDQFEARMAALHGELSDYDEMMDFHVSMETDDLDPFAAALVADNKPVLVAYSQGKFSLFIEIPHALIIELVGPKLSILKPQPLGRCGAPRRPGAVDNLALLSIDRTKELPAVRPLRTVYASTTPRKDAEFIAKYYNGSPIDITQPDAETFLGKHSGSCYTAHGVRWENTGVGTNYEYWWIYSPNVRKGSNSLKKYETYLKTLHGEITSLDNYDEYMDSHVCIIFDEAEPIISHLRNDGVPYFLVGQFDTIDIFIEGPGGQIYEVTTPRGQQFTNVHGWDICKTAQHTKDS